MVDGKTDWIGGLGLPISAWWWLKAWYLIRWLGFSGFCRLGFLGFAGWVWVHSVVVFDSLGLGFLGFAGWVWVHSVVVVDSFGLGFLGFAAWVLPLGFGFTA